MSDDAPSARTFRVGFTWINDIQSEPQDPNRLLGVVSHQATDMMPMRDWLEQLTSRIVVQDLEWQRRINALKLGSETNNEEWEPREDNLRFESE
jgi:hypothetical protein